MHELSRSGHEHDGAGTAATTGAAGKRTRTQALAGGGGATTAPIHQHPPATTDSDPFDFTFDDDDYAAIHAALSSTARAFIEQQADTFHDAELTDVTWSALEQATGKPRAWLTGYLQWVYRHTHATQAVNTAPLGVLERTDAVPYTGTTSVDADGHTAYYGTFHGSRFPNAKYRNDLKVELNQTIRDEYLVTLDQELPDVPRGMKLLMTAMVKMEEFKKGSKSYTSNNPGNIKNTDDGKVMKLDDLGDGIRYQYEFLKRVAEGKESNYPIGEKKVIPPKYSEDIAKNASYGKSPYLPGYEFVYTGQLDQFIKIYATGSRAGNNYINTIVSYFKQNGIDITPEMTLQEIISIE